jgi:hypothetical protein
MLQAAVGKSAVQVHIKSVLYLEHWPSCKKSDWFPLPPIQSFFALLQAESSVKYSTGTGTILSGSELFL